VPLASSPISHDEFDTNANTFDCLTLSLGLLINCIEFHAHLKPILASIVMRTAAQPSAAALAAAPKRQEFFDFLVRLFASSIAILHALPDESISQVSELLSLPESHASAAALRQRLAAATASNDAALRRQAALRRAVARGREAGADEGPRRAAEAARRLAAQRQQEAAALEGQLSAAKAAAEARRANSAALAAQLDRRS